MNPVDVLGDHTKFSMQMAFPLHRLPNLVDDWLRSSSRATFSFIICEILAEFDFIQITEGQNPQFPLTLEIRDDGPVVHRSPWSHAKCVLILAQNA